MRHVNDDRLTLYHYEPDACPEVRVHLSACSRCSAEYARLAAFLDGLDAPVVPARDEDYGARVWAALEPRLSARTAERRPWLTLPRLALAGSMAVLIVAAFLYGQQRGRTEGLEALSAEARQRLLVNAVSEHLEKSERMLVELTNLPAGEDVSLGEQQRRARQLRTANRIYSATAQNAGWQTMADLLDELERVLLDISNSPEKLDAAEFHRLWRRVEASGVLIKLKLLDDDARRPIVSPAASPATRT